MPYSVDANNGMLDQLGSVATTVGLTVCTTLTATATAGDTQITVSDEVGVADRLGVENGEPAGEEAVVTAVSGSGPYTVTLDQPLDSGHSSGALVALAAKDASRVLEPAGGGYARQSATWGAAANEQITLSNAPQFTVAGDTNVGGYAAYDSGGTFLGAFLADAIEELGASGTVTIQNGTLKLVDLAH